MLQNHLNVPKKRTANLHPGKIMTESLPIKGQGVASIELREPATLLFTIYNETKSEGLKLNVCKTGCVLYKLYLQKDQATEEQEWIEITSNDQQIAGLDPDINCNYWFSIDGSNQCVSYGKGEMRAKTVLLLCDSPEFQWIKEVSQVIIETSATSPIGCIWRDPITIDPALAVVETNSVTMMDLACNVVTVPENLTPACKTIYANVAGKNFKLDTSDFPDFVQAIEASIRNKDGWCYQKLKEKAGEFGGQDDKETYLRITMGVNQGDSPGIPNVMEIWPPGHYSPIHNHGDANAIIRVLHGEIEVKLYPLLSVYHTEPILVRRFEKDQVTWLSPGLNQVHKLTNTYSDGPTCITIQSYIYGEDNDSHYEYFDYLEGNEVKQFSPNSDMSFVEFKRTMKEEWQKRMKKEKVVVL